MGSTVGSLTKTGLQSVRQEAAPLRRKIGASIRRAIETGLLAPGARLIEQELCQDLSVSRTSLREALRELEADGIIARGSRGVVVAQITEDEARNIYHVRAALEGLVAEQFAIRADARDMAALDDVVAALTRSYKTNKFAAIVSEKDRFYEVLCRGAKNLVVLDLLTRLNSRINRLRALSRANPVRGVASLREIEAIAKALRLRDPVAAKRTAVAHVERAAEAALKLSHAEYPISEFDHGKP